LMWRRPRPHRWPAPRIRHFEILGVWFYPIKSSSSRQFWHRLVNRCNYFLRARFCALVAHSL